MNICFPSTIPISDKLGFGPVGAVALQIIEENIPDGLVLLAFKPNLVEEIPAEIFFILYIGLFAGDPMAGSFYSHRLFLAAGKSPRLIF